MSSLEARGQSVLRQGVHRGWWVAGAAFLAIAAAGGYSTMGGLLVDPLHREFGWSHSDIALSMSVNMVLYGLTAPFAAAMMDPFGVRRLVGVALSLLAVGALLTTMVSRPWQLVVCWGILTGLGTGSMALTFAAAITNRWFVRRQGVVTGILASGSVLGQFLFLPLLGWVIERFQWRFSLVVLMVAAAAVAPVVYFVLRDHPRDVGIDPYGATEHIAKPAPIPGAALRTLRVFVGASRTWPFWLLAGTFAICGASTNGVMWTHFVPAAHMAGMAIPVAASMLTLVGVFNIVGTLGSGWLTDRFDPRVLLSVYYLLRGVSLLLLPHLLGPNVSTGIITFAVFFGILDLATVPPTISLCRRFYGNDGAIVFGWVNAGHQVGAASVALLGGVIRDETGTYNPVWLLVGVLCIIAAVLAQLIARKLSRQPVPAAISD